MNKFDIKLVRKVKKFLKKVMVWGAMGYGGVGNLSLF